MAFSEIFDGGLTGNPFPLGPVASNVFVVQGQALSPWVKVRIGIYTQIPDVGIVEIGNTYLPIGDDRLILGIIEVPESRFPPPYLAFAEVIYRYPPGSPIVCKIYCGDVEDMIFEPINAETVSNAIATRNETSSDIINTSATAVASVKAPNANRTGGFMEWKGGGAIYVGFGGPPARKDTSKLTQGAKILIPQNFVGEIFVDWNGNQVAPNSPPASFKVLLCIEYLR